MDDADSGEDGPVGDASGDAAEPTVDTQGETEESTLSREQAVRDILRGSGIIYFGLVANMSIAFVAQRFAAVHLPIDGFGGITTGMAVLNLGGMLSVLGLSAGLTRYLPRVADSEKRRLALYSYAFILPTSIVLGGAIVLGAEAIAAGIFDDPGVTISIRIFGAAIPFAAIFNVAVGGIRGQKRPKFWVYVKNFLHPLSRFFLVMVAVLVGLGQGGFAVAYALPFVLSAFIATYLFNRTLPTAATQQAGDSQFTDMVGYSLPFTISRLASFVYRSIDIFLILYLLDSRAVGLYAVAYAFAKLLGMFSTAANFLGSPVASELEHDDRIDDAVSAQQSIARWLAIASIFVVVPMMLFGADLLRIIYRPAYSAGGLAVAILVVGFAAKNVLLTHEPLLQALGRSKDIAFNTATAAVVNVGLNLWLIPRYGIEGAAVATTVSFLVLGGLPVLQVYYYTRLTALSQSVVAPVLVALPLVLVASRLATYIPASLPWIGLFTTGFVGIYGIALVVIVGFTQTDVMVIKSIEEEYGIDIGPLDAIVRRFS